MARAKKKEKSDLDGWAHYDSIQLTPGQRMAARTTLEEQTVESAKNGVWEQFAAIEGKLRLTYDVDALREDALSS